MDPEELSAALTLLAFPRAGPATIARLLGAAGSPRQALLLPPARLEDLGLHPDTRIAHRMAKGRPSAEAMRQRDRLLALGVQALISTEVGYPPLLRQIPRPPPILFLRGCAATLHRPQVAIVGSRSPTPSGREIGRAHV